MVSSALTETEVLDRLETRWINEGYQLIRQPEAEQLPSFLRGFRPDAIAIGPTQSLVIEIMRNRSPSADTKVRQMQGLFKGHPDWRLEVIYAAPEGIPLSKATDDEIAIALEEARRVSDIAPRPALLLLWSIFEAIGRRLEPDLAARSLTPGSLIDVMISKGRLPQEDSQFLHRIAKARNALAHGLLDLNPPQPDVVRLLDLCEQLSHELPV